MGSLNSPVAHVRIWGIQVKNPCPKKNRAAGSLAHRGTRAPIQMETPPVQSPTEGLWARDTKAFKHAFSGFLLR